MRRLAACLALWSACLLPAGAFAQVPQRALVVPFENVSHDSKIVWIGEAAAILLADNLNVFGYDAITRDERLAAFEQLKVPPNASLTDATIIRIGQLVKAGQV